MSEEFKGGVLGLFIVALIFLFVILCGNTESKFYTSRLHCTSNQVATPILQYTNQPEPPIPSQWICWPPKPLPTPNCKLSDGCAYYSGIDDATTSIFTLKPTQEFDTCFHDGKVSPYCAIIPADPTPSPTPNGYIEPSHYHFKETPLPCSQYVNPVDGAYYHCRK